MKAAVRYGKGHIEVEIPDENLVCELRAPLPPAPTDAEAALAESLANPIGSRPLEEVAAGRQSAAIVISDITRPAPNDLMLRHIIGALRSVGLAASDITILVATGGHRPNVGWEWEELVGPDIAREYAPANHDCKDLAAHVHLCELPHKIPLYVDERYIRADLKILTGLVEPHYIAGFSGGRKAVCPGLAALTTIREFHRPEILLHPKADTTILDGNPIHEASLAAARAAGADFIVNTAVDESRRITGVWSGDLEAAHEAGCRVVGEAAVAYCPEPVDIVVTSNAGYPLDCNIYQATKGMVGALPILKEGGTVLLASSCQEGLGSEGFSAVVRAQDTIEETMERLNDIGGVHRIRRSERGRRPRGVACPRRRPAGRSGLRIREARPGCQDRGHTRRTVYHRGPSVRIDNTCAREWENRHG